ncbi:hypothetical protein BOX15_Mlig029314g4 [Macrostomum lignano]|uniref:Monocyte to macrophage differentiation factor 2 n=1 Tax=Macrostomum lignano TaxID=282301 RepID=A0A267GBH2_9PLAT|nr:hypothetical protein BOX15_Mlig029314g4 [Macrostomum lignano]
MTDIHRRLVKSASQLNLSKYKNQRAQPGQPYVPTRQEHLANILSHLFMIPASLYRMYTMLSRSADSAQTITSLIYGASGICLFLISSLFHIFAFRGGPCQLKEIFHRCDRVFIYIFIAASYTPWLVLRDFEYDIGTSCMYTVWTAAILGITYQLLFHEKKILTAFSS